jgi:hypothetical protein
MPLVASDFDGADRILLLQPRTICKMLSSGCTGPRDVAGCRTAVGDSMNRIMVVQPPFSTVVRLSQKICQLIENADSGRFAAYRRIE